jgi:phytoene dehydrogenase-like protein
MALECDAVVVGSGPNGLAAAITIAQAGYSVRVIEGNSTVGGGARSAELTLPGFVHDVCSAIHPLAAGSPFFQTLPLAKFGLEWIHPEIPLAHPLDDGTAAALHREVDITANALGTDARNYHRVFAPLTRHWSKLAEEFLQPMLHMPKYPLTMAGFGIPALCPATLLARLLFKGEPARALFGGMAAHSFLPLEALASAAFGLILGTAGHAVGWPIPRGGSQSIANALADYLCQLGGTIETNRRVATLDDLPKSRAIFFDVSAWQFAHIAGDRLPGSYRDRLTRFQHAPGVFKIDYALSAPIPWKADACKRAGTVHLGGTLAEIAAAERDTNSGKIPEQPFVLVAQQSVFDSTRVPRNQHTLWAYCHVPFGCNTDMSERIEAQIERFAPGFRDCIVARHKSGPGELEQSNANLAGGDINGGAANLWQLLARPVLSATPYRTPAPGMYLCSASTPPGGGVHGMCGHHAARAALRDVFQAKLS